MHNYDLLEEFKKKFGDAKGAKTYFAPGRVNLIGEHIDYNGGYVFPCALTIGTFAVARKREDDKIHLFSLNFAEDGVYETTLGKLYQKEDNAWTNYPKGIIYTLCQGGYNIKQGMDILYYGTIPNSSGLSSSASIEVLTGYICMDLFGLDYDMPDLALICQHAENHYNGVNCGIMDQFSIAMGKKKCALYLNTNTMEYSYVEMNMKDTAFVIMNTNKKRGLLDSKYNERRDECEQALRTLQTKYCIDNLCQLKEEDWEEALSLLSSDLLRKRVKHVVTENKRTYLALEALRRADISEFGRLMNDSHDSLRDDYEVTGRELDTLVAAAREQEGVLGARMTGAGFGGCSIALVNRNKIDEMIEKVSSVYLEKIGYSADFYVVEVGGGPQIL